MSHVLALDSHLVVIDLYELLRDLDPMRWRQNLDGSFRQRLAEMDQAIDDLQDRFSAVCSQGSQEYDELLARLREQLARLSQALQENMPSESLASREMQRQWRLFRDNLLGSYQDLAGSLRQFHIQVPQLRPTNWYRSLFHSGAALVSLLIVEFALGPVSMLVLAGAVAAIAWTLEISRRYSHLSDRFSWWIFGRMAHPHERRQINSATWYSSALLLMSLTGSPMVCSVALGILGFADPAAGLVGRRWGRRKLVQGRTLEGSLAFVGVGFLVATAILRLWHHDLGFLATLALAGGAVVPGALAELFARKLDDNLLVPVAAAAGAGLVGMLLGLL